ncbi:hypothetical protein LZF95_02745 [Algoriphagus sp. AGSA1]|uniref:hypothetical protein n=1 Tax=Algoriphagus sp. AGSA1 TaxID=2907213 RepID=UPI001F3AECF2|nr:hypothetical protein [Algoriphagus sp. AGSA1]MCE7053580.1 hypothetical protein [Algoriphagus sp. AGSA1]
MLIAEQKWLHFNVVQSNESWIEMRRLDKLDFEFWVDNSKQQSTQSLRWVHPGSEKTYNRKNHTVVQPQDKLTTSISGIWTR